MSHDIDDSELLRDIVDTLAEIATDIAEHVGPQLIALDGVYVPKDKIACWAQSDNRATLQLQIVGRPNVMMISDPDGTLHKVLLDAFRFMEVD